MDGMTRSLAVMCCLAFALFAADAPAQQIIQPGGNLLVPQPPPPPPPKIEVPAVPQLGEVPRPNYVPKTAPPSFGDRVTRCLHEGAAAGLGPNERAAYSRSCANQQ